MLAGLPRYLAWDRDPDCRVGEEGELCFGFETLDGGAEECEDVCCAVEGESCDEIIPEILVSIVVCPSVGYLPRSETEVAVYEEEYDEESNSKYVNCLKDFMEAISIQFVSSSCSAATVRSRDLPDDANEHDV
jgi:hypothetical protein